MFRASVLCFVAAVALQSVSALPNPEDLVKVENLLGAAKGKATGLASQATQLLPTQATDAVSQVTGTVQDAAPGIAVRSCTTCGGKGAQEKTETETPTKPIGAAARCSLCEKRRAELAAQRKAEQQKSDDTATVPANVKSRHGKRKPKASADKKNGKSQGLTDAQKSANAQKAKSQNSGKSQKSAKAQAPGHTDATQGNKPGQNAKAQSTGKTQGLTDAQKSANAQKSKSHNTGKSGRSQKAQSTGKTQGLSDAQKSANAQKAKATKSTSSKSGKKTE